MANFCTRLIGESDVGENCLEFLGTGCVSCQCSHGLWKSVSNHFIDHFLHIQEAKQRQKGLYVLITLLSWDNLDGEVIDHATVTLLLLLPLWHYCCNWRLHFNAASNAFVLGYFFLKDFGETSVSNKAQKDKIRHAYLFNDEMKLS